MGVWRSIFGWKALFRWDALGVIVPGIFIAVGVGVLSVDWFPYHLLIAQICFAVAAVLCVIKFVGHAIESEGNRWSRWLFGIILSSILIALTIWVDCAIQMHEELVALTIQQPPMTPPNKGEKPQTSQSTPSLTPPQTKPQNEKRTQAKKPLPKEAALPPLGPEPESVPQNQQQCATGSLCNQDSTVNAPQTVNNFGPPPLPTPNAKVCVSPPKLDGGEYATVINVRTDTQITRPFFVFFFDGPVESGSFEMDNHIFGCNCPMRADKLPNPERSIGFRVSSIDMGSNIWFPADGPIKATIKSKTPISLVQVLAGGGQDVNATLDVKLLFKCD